MCTDQWRWNPCAIRTSGFRFSWPDLRFTIVYVVAWKIGSFSSPNLGPNRYTCLVLAIFVKHARTGQTYIQDRSMESIFLMPKCLIHRQSGTASRRLPRKQLTNQDREKVSIMTKRLSEKYPWICLHLYALCSCTCTCIRAMQDKNTLHSYRHNHISTLAYIDRLITLLSVFFFK
jgi:hypothetical protein